MTLKTQSVQASKSDSSGTSDSNTSDTSDTAATGQDEKDHHMTLLKVNDDGEVFVNEGEGEVEVRLPSTLRASVKRIAANRAEVTIWVTRVIRAIRNISETFPMDLFLLI